MNKVILIGRLTADPELRHTQSGLAVANFTLAVDRGFKGQDGEQKADFIPIVTWRNLAENCAKYLAKGRLVAVSGRIQTGSYTATDGTKRYTTDVVADEVKFLEWSDKGQAQQEQSEIPGFTPIGGDGELPF